MNADSLFLDANTAYEAGDFIKAHELFLQAAENGDCYAMTRLAVMCDNGEGVPSNINESIEWDMKAIAAGSESSMLNLGITFRRLGDFENSKYWLEKMLELGDGEAALELAKLYNIHDPSSPLVKHFLAIAMLNNNLSQASIEELNEWKFPEA